MTIPAKPRAAIFGSPWATNNVYGQGRRERVAEFTQLHGETITGENLAAELPALRELEVIFSTWGMPALTHAQLDQLPNLKAVFYAAGSVQAFAAPLLEREITVVSAWQANAVAVAEYTFAQILLANKGYFRNVQDCSTYAGRRSEPFHSRGNYGATVAILGCGAIGSRVADYLKHVHLNVITFDPFLSDERAASLNVRKVSLNEAFEQGDVVSCHLANNEKTKGMLAAEQFRRLKDNAVFINTGRGATVDEPAMLAELHRRPTITALLDVTFPEPPEEGSPMYALPNVHLTSHIAGALGDEVLRMADWMIEAFGQWQRGEKLPYKVSADMLATMA